MGTTASLYSERDKENDEYPENGEWHELGHHLYVVNVSDGVTLCATCKNHDGYLNANTSDSMDEGFAGFIGGIAWAFIEEEATLANGKGGIDPGGVNDRHSYFPGTVETNGNKPWTATQSWNGPTGEQGD